MFTKGIHYSTDLERAILGICLIEQEAFGRCYQLLEINCFYHDAHKHVFDTIKNMYVNGIPIDLFTVTDQFTRVQNKKTIAGQNTDYFLTQLTNYVVSSAHIEYHSYLIKTMWLDREVMILTRGGDNKLNGDARDKIKQIQDHLYSLQQKTTVHDWADMTSLMVQLYQHQDEIKKSGGIGMSCGIGQLDHANGGFHPGQMIVIGARPSVGKSALAGSMALHMSQNKKKVGIVSLEMSNVEIAARIAALDTETDFHVLYRGLYKDQRETEAVYKRIGNHTSALPIYVSDKTNVNVVEIRSKADKLKSLHGIDILIIDYLQLIDTPDLPNRNRENEIARVSRYCKVMAKEMNIPVVLLCQLNRESTRRHGDNRYPQLSDLRESGAIEQDADIVMFLHRDFMSGVPENEKGESTENQADLVIRKWRNGKNNFIIPLDFDPPKMKFTARTGTQNPENWRPVDIEYPNNQ